MRKVMLVGLFVAAFSIIAAGQTQPTVKKTTKPVTTEKKVTTVTTAKTVTPVKTVKKVTTVTTDKKVTTTTTKKKPAPVKKISSALFTCPMHPEIAMKQAGKCPKCGMNLEKKG